MLKKFFQSNSSKTSLILYDKTLLLAVIALICLGVLMVASSSIVISQKYYHQSFHFLFRQCVYLIVGVFCGFIVIRIDTNFWQKTSGILLLFSMLLLIAVLIPGVGRSVNGSVRWINLGPIGIQVSEITKLIMVMYISSYLVRHEVSVRTKISGFIKPMLILGVIGVLLLKEPDFGAAVVISITVLAMLFLAGVQLKHFLGLVLLVGLSLVLLAVSSPYRMARLTAFLNPWADQFNSGYQLTQSLIAFGRGGWFGVGLGESVQKLFYLPEAHTDFLFAVLAEELGLAGITLVLLLYSILITRGLMIARKAQCQSRNYAAYMAYGLSFWLGFQAIINMGVNAGLLPTKGLTLPLMSYGGASMMMACIVIALLMRIDHENRWNELGLGKAAYIRGEK